MAKRQQVEVVEISGELKKLGRKQRWTAEDAATIVDAWRRSGSPLATFARAMGVGEQRIRKWRDGRNKGRVGQPATKVPSLVPVKVTGTMGRPQAEAVVSGPKPKRGRMEIELSRGRSLRVGVDFDASAVARLVMTLEQLGC